MRRPQNWLGNEIERQAELDELRNRFSHVETYSLDLERNRAEAETHHRQEVDRLTTELQTALRSREAESKKAAGLSADLERLQTDRDSLASNLERLQTDRDGLASNLERLQTDRDGLAGDLQRLQTEHDGLAGDLQRLKADRDGLAAELSKVRTAAETAAQQAQAAAEGFERERGQAKQKFDEELGRSEALRRDLQELTTARDGLSAELATARSRIEDLDRRLEAAHQAGYQFRGLLRRAGLPIGPEDAQ